MKCKRCGHDLPLIGFTCTNCGMMMSSEQIKLQKERIACGSNRENHLVSEKYGHKKFIYQKRESVRKKCIGIFLLWGIPLLFLFILIFVYL